MSVVAAKKCEFDSLGKMLHQIRKQIAALFAPKVTLNTPKLVTEFSDPHWGQIAGVIQSIGAASSWRQCIQHHILR